MRNQPSSLDAPDIAGHAAGEYLADTRPSVEAQTYEKIRSEALTECIARLKPRSQVILKALHGLDRDRQSLRTVAGCLGLTLRKATEERDYAVFQLRYQLKYHRHNALLAA